MTELAIRSRSAPSPTTPRWSPSGRASETGSHSTASPSTTCCTRATRPRPRRTWPATSTSRGTRRWRGCAPVGWPRPRAARPGRWRCATPTRTSPRSCSSAPTATSPSPGAARRPHGRRPARVDSPQATLLPLAHLAGLGLDPGTIVARAALRRHGRQARRPRRRRARRGDGARRRRGRRRLRHRRQPAGVRQGGHDRQPARVRVADPHRPYDHCTMTVLDDVDVGDRRPVRRAAAVDVVRRPGGAPAARARRAAGSGGRAAPPGTSSSRRAVDRLGFYGADGRSWSRATRRDVTRCRSSSSATSGSTVARHVLVKLALADRRPATWSRCAAASRAHPPPRRLVPSEGPPLATRRRAPETVGRRRARQRRRRPLGRSGTRRRCRPGMTVRSHGRRPTGDSPPGARRSSPADPTAFAARPRRSPSGPTEPAGLYAQAAAAQWDPTTAIDWTAALPHDRRVEAAVVQVMTFLIENEEAALVVPARFLGQIHPHFREIQQMLAITVADEARHIEVFTRRSDLSGRQPALSTVGGRASLQTLLDEPDFAIATFLLSVMGEGTFVVAARLPRTPRARRRHPPHRPPHPQRRGAPRRVLARPPRTPRRARTRPARPTRPRRRAAPPRPADTPPGSTTTSSTPSSSSPPATPHPARIAAGWQAVQPLQHEMADGRAGRLPRLGFSSAEAETLAALHTRNFM